jgi:hypothetical protein
MIGTNTHHIQAAQDLHGDVSLYNLIQKGHHCSMQQILYNITGVLSQNQMFLLDLLLSCNSERFSSEKLAHQDHAAPVGKCNFIEDDQL